MTKKQKTPPSMKRVVEAAGSGTHDRSGANKAESVTPTSERIIKATSVKRRTAMRVLANR